MDLVLAFTNNNFKSDILVRGSFEEPLFKANDIANVLEISNIRASTLHFDETQKITQTIETETGKRDESIAKCAQEEGMCPAKMSRSITTK